jgi:hypothetical protein
MTLEIRPASQADIDAYAAEQSPYRVRGYVAVVDERIIAIGGVAYLPTGVVLAFLDADEEARAKPITLWKMAKRVVREAHARGVSVINATCDGSVEAGPRFLTRLGFTHLGEGVYQHEA